jgi:hypothetical protein
MSRNLRPLLAFVVALAVAGCGNESAKNGSTGSSSSKTASTEKTTVTFSECMRENGVSGFPDPDASGELTIDAVLNGSSLDPDSPVFKRAMDACEDLQPAGFTGDKRTAAEQDKVLRFAQCVRDNGVPDFPDPTTDSPIVDTTRIPSVGNGPPPPALDAAMQTCGDILAGVVKAP